MELLHGTSTLRRSHNNDTLLFSPSLFRAIIIQLKTEKIVHAFQYDLEFISVDQEIERSRNNHVIDERVLTKNRPRSTFYCHSLDNRCDWGQMNADLGWSWRGIVCPFSRDHKDRMVLSLNCAEK